ncbi:oligosaccharide flippase family protein [Candidatus Pacearchaeota archaeon]|nr:oligosaccharide flippase family protein [Candidatus Pacearchaeota archaeon]
MNALQRKMLTGSFVLLITFNIFHFMNFVFQFSMARLLTLAEYGLLAALLVVIYILSIFSESIQTLITKYASKESSKGKLKNLFTRIVGKSFYTALILFGVYLALAFPLSEVLKIPYPLLALSGIAIFTSLLVPVGRGIMQGRKQFGSLGANLVVEAVLKVLLGIVLVLVGWRVYGAMAAIIISMLIAFFLSYRQLRDILSAKEKQMKTNAIYQQAFLIFIVTFAVTAFYSIDLLLARVFFSAEQAGAYALAAVLGKIIFWGTQPVSKAMFPLSSESTNTKRQRTIFLNSLVMLFILIAIALILFGFFPELIVSIFSGKSVPDAVSILFYTGVAMSLLACANLVLLSSIARIKDSKNSHSLLSLIGYSLYFLILLGIEALILKSFAADLSSFAIGLVLAALVFLLASWLFSAWTVIHARRDKIQE